MKARASSSLLFAGLAASSAHALLNGLSPKATSAATSPDARSRRPFAQQVPRESTLSLEQQQQELNAVAKQGLEAFATECNPDISYFDPLGLADKQFWGLTNAETIAFLRHAEMKHGRIAMLGFLGYTVQANGVHFPWATEANGFPPSELSPPEQWELFSPLGKVQLFVAVGLLELWSEAAPGAPHYMTKGGVPGKFPPFVDARGKRLPGLPVDLWDPTNTINSNWSDATKAKKLAKEVNNGRLAMLGLFSFFVESKTPGAVPLLSALHVVKPFAGDYMLPFSYWDFLNYFISKSEFAPSAANAAAETAVGFTSW